MLKNVSLTELEKLTTIIFKNPNADKSLTQTLHDLSDQCESDPTTFQDLFQHFINTNVDTCQFWLLNILINISSTKYKYLTDEDRSKFRSALIYLFDSCITKLTSKQYILSKYCVLFVSWLKHDYPENWSDAFKILLSCIFNSQNVHENLLKLSKYYYLLI